MMGEERVAWTDPRLDDAFERIHARLRKVEDVSVRLARVEEQLSGVHGDTRQIKTALEARARERELERREREKDRRNSIKWLVGVGLTTAGIIVAAVGVLQGFVG